MTEEKQAAQVLNEAMRKLLKHELRKKWDAKSSATLPTESPPQKSGPFNGILDCRPKTIYRAFRVLEGGKPDEKPTTAPGGKQE